MPEEKRKAVVTVLGADRVGIVAGITATLAEREVNIEDISMTVMGDIFTMVMLVDVTSADKEFLQLKESLETKGKELGVQVMIQREEAFRYMHRV